MPAPRYSGLPVGIAQKLWRTGLYCSESAPRRRLQLGVTARNIKETDMAVDTRSLRAGRSPGA